jgi:hypothetical protein
MIGADTEKDRQASRCMQLALDGIRKQRARQCGRQAAGTRPQNIFAGSQRLRDKILQIRMSSDVD